MRAGNSIQMDEISKESEDRAILLSSKDKLSNFVILLSFFSAIGGFLFGYDTGIVSGALIIIEENFPDLAESNVKQEVFVSITVGAAALFALIGGILNDQFGRRITILLASATFTVGAIILGVATNYATLVIGRVIIGIGIGLASMTVPMYIAEVSPRNLRGRLVTVNNLFITGGQFIAGLIAGAFSYDQKNGWRFMLGLAGIPSLIQFVGFLFLPESPRWLAMKEKNSEALNVLLKIRNTSEEAEAELQEITDNVEKQNKIAAQFGSTPLLVQMLRTPHVRRALIVGCGMQMFQQLAGINTVMYYSATIIKMSGVNNNQEAIWLAAVVAFVNFLFTLVGVYLVEKLGRRLLSIYSMTGVVASLLFLAGGFLLVSLKSPPAGYPVLDHQDQCTEITQCNECILKQTCGFCYEEIGSLALNGSCVQVNSGQTDLAAYGRCSESISTNSSIMFAYGYCPTSYAWITFFGLLLYLVFFAPGMGPMPWTINSEIYPHWARSKGNACSAAVNWSFNLFISMTFLSLTEAITRYGTFFLYAGISLVGIIFMYFFLPETKGKKLEEVERLFMKPWCGRHSDYESPLNQSDSPNSDKTPFLNTSYINSTACDSEEELTN